MKKDKPDHVRLGHNDKHGFLAVHEFGQGFLLQNAKEKYGEKGEW